jgi:hypothetical protein
MSTLGKITITMNKANLTYDACILSTMNPYFTSNMYGSNYKYNSKVKRNAGKYPQWDETFSLDFSGERSVIIDIWHDTEIIGRAEIFCFEIIEKVSFKADYALFNGTSPRGQILVKVNYASLQPLVQQFGNIKGNDNYVNSNSKINTNQLNILSNSDSSQLLNTSPFNNSNKCKVNVNNNSFIVQNKSNPYIDNNINNKLIDNSCSNNINSVNEYQKTLTYYKFPLFFQHNSKSIWLFDFKNKNWRSEVNSSSEFFHIYHRATELPDGSFLITGGEYNSQSINSTVFYSSSKGNFFIKSNMNVKRKAHGSVYASGFVFVFGGFGNSGILKDCEKYDIENDKWIKISSMAIPIAYTNAIVFGNNLIFLVGGFTGEKIDGVINNYFNK